MPLPSLRSAPVVAVEKDGSKRSRLLAEAGPYEEEVTMQKLETLFWELAAELQRGDPRVVEGTIMNGRCLRVDKEFLALIDRKGSGLVVKLPKARVTELIEQGEGQPFAPAGKVFKEWLSVPHPDRRRWRMLLREGIAHVSR